MQTKQLYSLEEGDRFRFLEGDRAKATFEFVDGMQCSVHIDGQGLKYVSAFQEVVLLEEFDDE